MVSSSNLSTCVKLTQMGIRNIPVCIVVLILCQFRTLYSLSAFSSSESSCQKTREKYCEPDLCKKVTCPPPEECASGHIEKSGSPYDCCGTCIIYLDEGEQCVSHEAAERGFLKRRCKNGLSCKDNLCQLDPTDGGVTSCLQMVKRREEALNYMENDEYVFSRHLWIPKCDSRGRFEAKQCKKKKCFCVDEDGNRLFGQEERDLAVNMTCGCSRKMQALQKENPDFWMTKPQHHCSQDGNYDTLQCLGDICYCADPKTGDVDGKVAKMAFMDILPCYDPKKHKKLYKTQCEKQLMRARSLVYWFKQKGMHIVGLEDVRCDVDGSFAPKQCLTDRCVCTDRDGVSIKSYAVEAKKVELVRSMTCRCARDEHDRETFHARYPRMVCNGDDGNFDSRQCFDGKCYCVDDDGDVIVENLPLEAENFCSCRRKQLDVRNPLGLGPCIVVPTTEDYIDYADY